MKAQESSALQVKEAFLNANPTINETSKPFTDNCEIGPDDEVWLLQCPHNIDIDAIINRKIKLPGKSRHEHIESIAEKFPSDEIMTLGTHSSRGYKMKNIPISGHVVIRERLNIHNFEKMQRDPEPDLSSPTDRSSMFEGLKVRHPLLGADYEDKTELKPSIMARLKEASRTTKQKKKKKTAGGDKLWDTSSLASSRNRHEVDCADHSRVKVKKEKSTKRHTEETLEEDILQKSKKVKKEENTDDLDWIKQL